MSGRIDVQPTEATLGAYVRGINLGDLDDAAFAEVEATWHKHAVLVFPDQHLSDDAHIDFSRRFGSLEKLINFDPRVHRPEFAMISNLRADGTLDVPDDDHDHYLKGNTFWHTDSSFKRIPAMASLLRAEEVPSWGGETEFADMRAAYDALDGDMKEWLDDKIAVHSFIYSQGLVGLGLLSDDEKDALPPVEHPVIRTHSATGRKSLYVGRHASHIAGEDVEESRALLQSLCEKACQPPRVFSHRWQPGDLVIWDNRCALHRGRPWPPDQRRVMCRTTVAGTETDNEWAL